MKQPKTITNIKVETVDRQEEGKTISISQLPECHFKYEVGRMVADTTEAKICILASMNNDGTWRAYIGYPDIRDLKANYKTIPGWELFEWNCEHVHDAESVKILGGVLLKELAVQLFPEWDKRKYAE